MNMTYNEAVTLAQKLKASSNKIQGIELFGSVLLNGHGRDADFAILVDDELAKEWWTKERNLIRVRWPDFLYEQRWIVKKFIPFAYSMTVNKRRGDRLRASADMLGIQLDALSDASGTIPDFEMFLVPVNWRKGKELDAQKMRSVTDLVQDTNTLGFLKRVAKDAASVA